MAQNAWVRCAFDLFIIFSSRLIFIGLGLIEGDLAKEDKVLKEKVLNIEPLVESQLQIIIQSVILYAITFEKAIDMTHLLYTDTSSKATYLFMLLTSLVSLCITFTKMLQAGRKPVLSTVFSVRALVVFIFIVTKFLLLAYLNSLALTSIVLGSIGFAVAEEDEVHRELFDNFFRGLCRPSEDPSAFCGENPPLTLFTATRTFPLFSLLGIYLYPLLYVIVLVIITIIILIHIIIRYLPLPTPLCHRLEHQESSNSFL